MYINKIVDFLVGIALGVFLIEAVFPLVFGYTFTQALDTVRHFYIPF